MADPAAALVLSGGSIQGAYQAGAIDEVFKQKFLPADTANFKPSYIYGVSTGALNGAFLSERAGRTGETDPLLVNWPTISNELVEFWTNNITSFSDLGKERNLLGVIFKILRKKFKGLLKMRALEDLVNDIFEIENFEASPVQFEAGVVGLNSGAYENVTIGSAGDDFIDYIVASSREPINMKIMEIGSEQYVDGGVREITPLGSAIAANAERIVCVIADPAQINVMPADTNYGNLMTLMMRVMGIIENETIINDIKTAIRINHICLEFGNAANNFQIATGHFAGKRYIPIITIRPTAWTDIDVLNFDSADIAQMIAEGRTNANSAITAGPQP